MPTWIAVTTGLKNVATAVMSSAKFSVEEIKAVSVAECGPLSISDGFVRKSEIQRSDHR
jgi:hypothetical protein